MYLLIKYIKSILWRVAKRLSYLEDARSLKVKLIMAHLVKKCGSSMEPASLLASAKSLLSP